MGHFDVGAKMASKVDREIGRRVRKQSTNGECNSGPVVGRCSYKLRGALERLTDETSVAVSQCRSATQAEVGKIEEIEEGGED